MILKVVEYEVEERGTGAAEREKYIDKIESAEVYFDEKRNLPAVNCSIENGGEVHVFVSAVAYLMNDNGKTIDKIKNENCILPE